MPEDEKPPKGLITSKTGRPSYLSYDPQSDEWQEEWQKIQKTLSDAGVDNSEITVWRKGKRDSRFTFVETIGVDGFTIQGLADRFGGGKYQLKTKIDGQFGPAFAIEIDDRVLGDLDKPQQTGFQQTAAAPVDPVAIIQAAKSLMGDSSSGTNMIVQMLERQEASREASRTEMTKMIVGLAGALAPVFVSMFSRPVDKESKLLEVLLPVLINKPQMDMTSSLAFIKELRSMAETGDKPNGGFIDKIGELLMASAPAIAGALMQPAQQPMRQITDAIPPEQMPMNTPAQPEQQPTPNINAVIPQVYAGMLIRAAANNADPATWAEMIADVADDAQWQALMNLLMRSDWLQILTTQIPALAPYGAWLNLLRDELLRDEDGSEQETEPETPAANPPASDAGKNGGKKTASKK